MYIYIIGERREEEGRRDRYCVSRWEVGGAGARTLGSFVSEVRAEV
jgi:hypothetical protein